MLLLRLCLHFLLCFVCCFFCFFLGGRREEEREGERRGEKGRREKRREASAYIFNEIILTQALDDYSSLLLQMEGRERGGGFSPKDLDVHKGIFLSSGVIS